MNYLFLQFLDHSYTILSHLSQGFLTYQVNFIGLDDEYAHIIMKERTIKGSEKYFTREMES